ncbi:MAG TPA: 2-C-methyl-D-erythritol 4-phosphate cytidylyltransferase [Bacteroidales bacterium]|nr:2-C-methyl-D-erythritol 4-phosphate cytidylyltransferase [Bacteroidales bacterium]
MRRYVLITAGGTGQRMLHQTPKQFLELGGKPILVHTFAVFYKFDPHFQFVLVLPDKLIQYWQDWAKSNNFSVPHIVATGGPTRFHSVKSGLKMVPDNSVVAVHDGVRPLVAEDTIKRVFDCATRFGNAIPVIESKDSLRRIEFGINKPLERSTVRLVQTPQAFHAHLLKNAYNRNYQENFTDDASVLEAAGHRINLVDGNSENIKITTPEDLLIAETLIYRRNAANNIL